MTDGCRIKQGTAAWFQLVGTLMSEAASRAGLASDFNLSFVERYSDGVELSEGRIQGIRFDIVVGQPSFRIGVGRDERADVTIEVTAAAARELNRLYRGDAEFPSALDRLVSTGKMRVTGDPSRMGRWMEDVHDPIVDRTG